MKSHKDGCSKASQIRNRLRIWKEELEALWRTIQETGEYFTIKGLE
ncbi:hypothetical protein HMPREF0322_00768 [Desulfitobacterium hafniense DP7]|uniref:Uncharacterized protein n=1 Tax=Desulfitobacterium hafniense DP7 TaxID=537010 RepID=G9XIJ2_DESHA|nr:hypothetical protein HMPREF0322_00768 [Desulfitobacterium hafniense DP7]